MNYTNQAKVEGFLQRELTDYEATIFNDLVASISSEIDSYTSRNWLDVGKTLSDLPDASVRYFDGNGGREIFIDDYASITSIEVQDDNGDARRTYTESDDWYMLPANKPTKGSLRLRNYIFDEGVGNVAITGVWSSGVLPADVSMTATALVGKSLQKNKALLEGMKSESIEGYSYTYLSPSDIDADNDKLWHSLDKYKKIVL